MPNNERKGKWQPFNALKGYTEALEEVKREKEKQNKPFLSPDTYEEINEAIRCSLEFQEEVILTYFKNGYLHNVSGVITKVDTINNFLVISNKKIKLDSITKIVI